MMTAASMPHLIDRLPPVRGSYEENVPLARFTWFRVGGPAEVLFRPADAGDLAHFLAERPVDVPVTVIGVGSNLLVRDGGVPGVVVRLGRPFADIAIDGERVTVGAAAMDMHVARAAAEAGLGGLEFLSGIPGTIGGAVRMNAGAFGSEIADVLVDVTALDGGGGRHVLPPAALGFGYRTSKLPAGWIVVAATLRGRPVEPETIAERMAEIRRQREDSQPLGTPTGGSTFANPPGEKAWKLIDAAGCRGLSHGGAQVSDKHCNFLVNTGTATAADLEDLGEEVRRRVKDTSGIALRWEIRCIGVPADDDRGTHHE